MQDKENIKENMDDLLIRSIIDKKDLTKSELICLEQNQKAFNQSETLLVELNKIGKMAVEFAPEPIKKIDLEIKPLCSVYFRPILAGSFALLLLLFVFTRQIDIPDSFNKQPAPDLVYQEMEKDIKFMTEIGILIDSDTFQEIFPDNSYAESKYDFSDEFMAMVVSI